MSSMDDARPAFLDAAATAVRLLERPEVAGHWAGASVLREFSVAGLAGHLFRGMSTVGRYLDEPEPSAADVSAAGISAASYFDTVIRSADISDPANQAIRARGEEAAAGGPAALAGDARATLERLTSRLAGEGPGRPVRVAGGLVLTLDEYLRTRVVELVVHADDLAGQPGRQPLQGRPASSARAAGPPAAASSPRARIAWLAGSLISAERITVSK